MESLSSPDSTANKKLKLTEVLHNIMEVDGETPVKVLIIDKKVNINNVAEVTQMALNKNLEHEDEDALTLNLFPAVVDPDLVNDDPTYLPNDSEPETENLDDLDDASTYYDDDDNDNDDDYSYYDETSSLQAQFDAVDLPPGVEASMPWLEQSDENQKQGASTGISSNMYERSEEDDEQVLKRYRQFKSFDTVQDFTDHYYLKEASASNQPTRWDWAKTIQKEWRILENDLPETIFVRVYEERMDFLRAVIIGAMGTPYHDGLFFFDILFPSDYPSSPPKVYYRSFGLRLNPNLYDCGKVCLSLLNTWPGRNKDEKWIPGKSTMLQVLLSIQALVLNEKPYFNEPGFELSAGQIQGEKMAKDYNEETFVLSCKTMLYTLRRPLKHFEDFVAGHFRVRAHSILEACREYLKGAEVGSHVETDEQEEEKQDILNDEKTNLRHFRTSLSVAVGNLIPALIKNGAKDCEKYIPLGDINRKAPLKI